MALPLVMMLDRDFTAGAIMQDNPSLDPAHLDLAINAVIVDAAIVHLGIATFDSPYSAAQATQFLWAVSPGDAIHLVMLALLWIPGSVRRLFAAPRFHPRPRPLRGIRLTESAGAEAV